MVKNKAPDKEIDLAKINRDAQQASLDVLEDMGLVEKKPINKNKVLSSKRRRVLNWQKVQKVGEGYEPITTLGPDELKTLSITEGISENSCEENNQKQNKNIIFDTRKIIYRKNLISESCINILETTFPKYRFQCGNEQPHPHPISAMERVVLEDIAYESITTTFGQSAIITDIGGNPIRHYYAKRTNVHCCNPVLDEMDVVRRGKRLGHPIHKDFGEFRTGEHKVQNCTLQSDVYMSIHSLYYLTQDEILALVVRSKQASNFGLIAVVHSFNEFYGKLHFNGVNYESEYEVTDMRTVTMGVNGNAHCYRHDPLFWLYLGKNGPKYYEYAGKAMVWEAEKNRRQLFSKILSKSDIESQLRHQEYTSRR